LDNDPKAAAKSMKKHIERAGKETMKVLLGPSYKQPDRN